MSAAPHTSPSPSLAQERTSTRTPFGLAITTLAMGGAFAMAAGANGQQGTNPLLGDLFSLSVAVW